MSNCSLWKEKQGVDLGWWGSGEEFQEGKINQNIVYEKFIFKKNSKNNGPHEPERNIEL